METKTVHRKMVVGIVILHYKNEDDTLSCLNSLHASKPVSGNVLVIVVLNGRYPDFSNVLKKKFPGILLVENNENEGYAGGNNRGIERALAEGCEAVMLLNNDTVVSKTLVQGLSTYLFQHDAVGIVSPKIYFAAGFEYHKAKYKENQKGNVIWYAGGAIDWDTVYASHLGVDLVDQGRHDTISQTDFATGCCMMVKRKVFERVGLFDEKYFLYYEDVDLCMRARRAGFSVQFYPHVSLWHKNASSSDKPGSPLHVYYQTRNRLYFGYRYAPLRTKKSLFLESMKMIIKGGVQSEAVRDYYVGRMGKSNR